MNAPLPTPHPLKPLAGFAFEPPLWLAAIILLAIVGLFLIIFLFLSRRFKTKRRDLHGSLALTIAHLERLTGLEPKAALAEASASIKRVLASLGILEIRQMDVAELRALATSLAPSTKKLIERLIQIDTLRFKRDIDESNCDELLTGLPQLLRDAVESSLPKDASGRSK